MAIKKILKIVDRFFPPIIWAGIIFLLSSYTTLPGPEIIWWDFIFKKSAHIFVYGGLFFWIQRAINYNSSNKKYLFALILTLAYAFSDEYHQSFIIGRTALLSDIAYDMLGASMVMLKLKKLI